MSFPQTLDPASPLGTDSPAQGDDQLRGIKQYLVDVLGLPGVTSVTAPAMSISTAGVLTIAQSPVNVPAEIRGPVGQALQLTSTYSSINFVVAGASVMSLTPAGLLMRQPAMEFQAGNPGRVGTQGADALILQTQGQPRWQIDANGMLLGSVDNTVDIGAVGSQRPRNVYIASNLIVGGQIQVGLSQLLLTNPDGSIGNTVTLTGSQTISGTKTFSAAPIITSTSGLLWNAGGPGYLGTIDSNTLEFLTNQSSRWQVDPSGMLRATVDNVVDIGRAGAQRPRNIYMGGRLTAGTGAIVVTTPTGMLDLTAGTVSGEVQGDLLTRQSSTWNRLAAGSSGFLLQSNGSGADAAWVVGSTASGVPAGQNPVDWTGGHTWSAPSFLLLNANVHAGIGTAVPTATLHVAGNTYVASNLFVGGGFISPGPTFFLSSSSVKAGIGTSLPTAMLHVAGSVYVASNIYMAGNPVSGGRTRTRITATGVYTFNVPAGVSVVSVTLQAAGGGGGGNAGGGGGGGEALVSYVIPVTAGGTITGSVGAGGAAATIGGSTTVTSPVSLTVVGGNGGAAGPSGTGGSGGAGFGGGGIGGTTGGAAPGNGMAEGVLMTGGAGGGSGGDTAATIPVAGGAVSIFSGGTVPNSIFGGGGGGASQFGAGGAGSGTNTPGVAGAANTGAGGGGGGQGGGGTGGAGGSGFVEIVY